MKLGPRCERGVHSIDLTVPEVSNCDLKPMQQLELTYAQECPAHDIEIEAINAEAFGPGRFTRAAHFIREGGPHDLSLSFVALMGGIVVGSVRLTPVVIGKTPALLLGPLAVRPEWKKRGIGGTLMRQTNLIMVRSASRWCRTAPWSCQRRSIRAGCSPANSPPVPQAASAALCATPTGPDFQFNL
jgi:GNAT superfamily N-acetyltransferase